jgi:hypothetical protein
MDRVSPAERLCGTPRHRRFLVVEQTADGWDVSGLPRRTRRFATQRQAICFALYGDGGCAARAVLLVSAECRSRRF